MTKDVRPFYRLNKPAANLIDEKFAAEAERDALKALVVKMREALMHALDQFRWYAEEHTKGGKTEKAATNKDMEDICYRAGALTPDDLAGCGSRT